jgi:hypothetical protein
MTDKPFEIITGKTSGLGISIVEPISQTAMIKYAKQLLKLNKELGVDIELKAKDLDNPMNAWGYILTYGKGIDIGHMWRQSNGKYIYLGTRGYRQ